MAEGLQRSAPELIVLGVRPGVVPCGKPPVRIFLGSEASQFRPERVLVWSVEQVRDPSRVYEIHLMKEIAGFDRRGWTTGFTNYRFAIPHFAGGRGRAIYNDEDQIYLTDPAELFDLDMQGHGFLAIAPRESSVMLIDCERMAEHWTLEAARHASKKSILSRSLAVPGLWGPLDGGWNARDDEYREGRSHLLHYTTLHTQPWRPLPERFVYTDNPLAPLWHDLERGADEAGFLLFDRGRPSARFRALVERGAAPCGRVHGWARPALADLRRRCGVEAEGLREVFGAPPQPCELAVVSAALESLPEDDVPWVLDEIFACARRAVFAAVEAGAQPLSADPAHVALGTPASRWPAHFEAVAKRHPEVSWELLVRSRNGDRLHRGGPFAGPGLPRVWVLEDARDAGGGAAAQALAARLGWPSETRGAGELVPPWPDLVLCAGPRAARAARRVRELSGGRVRAVRLGAGRGATPEDFDLVVTPAADAPFAHPRRVETALPLVGDDPVPGGEPAARLRERLAGAAAPRVGLVVAGVDGVPAAALAGLIEAVGRRARERGGSLFAWLEPRVAPRVRAAAGGAERLEAGELPALAELADELHWAGEAHELLARLCATGRPVTLHPLPRPRRWRRAGRSLVHEIALRGRSNDRGTLRPQQGLERLCARLIERGWVRPPRDPRRAEQALLRAGAARLPADRGPGQSFRPLGDLDHVAARVRSLLGSP